MPYVPPGEESLKEDGWWNAPSPVIGPTIEGPHHNEGGMPTVGPGPSTIGTELWEFPADNGTTPLEELGPARPTSPGGGGGGGGGGAVEFPEDIVSPGGSGILERAGNWFTDLF